VEILQKISRDIRGVLQFFFISGFATYAQRKGVDGYDPTYRSVERSVVEETQDIMYRDAFLSSEPVGKTVENPEYEWVPSNIVYSKGAALIRMVEGLMGEEYFLKALNEYLTEYSLDNADRDALWSYFEKVRLNCPIELLGHMNPTLAYTYMVIFYS
jgi:aminopeptidase N